MVKSDLKKKRKELVEEATERLAEIFIMQIECEKKDNIKKTHDKKEI